MVSFHLCSGLGVLLACSWLLLGSCSNSSKPDYRCGEEGVQLRVPAGYLGSKVKFQVRDEFQMGYDLDGCLSKCLLSAIEPSGESVFYTPYSVCIAVVKDGLWLLRVRLIGDVKTEDIDLICPKPKSKHDRVIPRTHKPRSTRWTTLSTPVAKTLTKSLETTVHHTTTNVIQDDDRNKVTILPTVGHRTKEMDIDISTTGPPPTAEHLVSVTCFPDGSFRLTISRYVTSPPLELASVELDPGTCPSPILMGDFLEFNGLLTTCGRHRFSEGQLVYELSLTVKPNILVSALGSITRDGEVRISAQCSSNSTISVWVTSHVASPPPLPSVSNSGELGVELRISKGSSYSSFYTTVDYPLQILLRELVFFEARLLQPSDPRLHLRLHHCWGAPSFDPVSTTKWNLIYDGCPYSKDDPMTKLLPVPVPSSYQRFVVSAFTFIGFPNNTQVYIFCSVSVCLPSLSESCTSECGNLTHRVRRSQANSLHLLSSTGPLIFQQDDGESGIYWLQHLMPAVSWTIIAAAFLIVLLLLTNTLKCRYFAVNFKSNLQLR
ncbi:zona pellucida sperm-binding protein 1-like [Pseudophryne corroboree]|uniref:zona pellucida sperm-binding protein 1-like n=1 Tax=Pseudophryne corroboree TaxID=495146 RepID=UPI00308196EF